MFVAQHCRALVLIWTLFFTWAIGSGLGPCPQLASSPPVNLSQLTGRWYEIERSFYFMELITTCVTLDITETAKGRLDIIVSTKSSWTGTSTLRDGIAIPTRRDPNVYLYRFNSNLPRLFNRYLPGTGFYHVIKTDYVNYALVYSCNDYQVFHIDKIWIWGRKNEIDAELRSDLYAVLAANNFDSERLLLSKTSNCTVDDYIDELDDYFL